MSKMRQTKSRSSASDFVKSGGSGWIDVTRFIDVDENEQNPLVGQQIAGTAEHREVVRAHAADGITAGAVGIGNVEVDAVAYYPAASNQHDGSV